MKKGLKIAIISISCVITAIAAGGLIWILYKDKNSTPYAYVPGEGNVLVNEKDKENNVVPTAEPGDETDNQDPAKETAAPEGEKEKNEDPQEEIEPREVGDEEVEAYLADSVIIGDSIVLGYRNYCRKSQDETLNAIRFLAAGSFSAHNAMWPVSEKSVHPLYQGEQRPVWESVSLMGANKVFICFGLNDLNIDEHTCEYYKEVIDNILEASPESDIHIISMTYTLKDQGKGKLNNDEIREYNIKLREMAEENGWGYVDIAPLLEDGEGNLAPEFCSDGFLHQNPAAYDIWTGELRRYIRERLSLTSLGEEE